MHMVRVDTIKRIIEKLTFLKTQIELENVMHLFDNNIGLEDFTCGLMNLVYGYNLKNLNKNQMNYPGIDLADPILQIAVQVTVEKQKVTDISILSYCDTEEYFFRAAPAVIEQMKAEQSLNVDAVSGATYSSNGVIHAVANALEIPEDQYAPRPGRNLTAKKKNHGHIVKHEITSQEEYEEKVEKYSK